MRAVDWRWSASVRSRDGDGRKKLELIEQNNAGWIDLAADWFRE